MKKKYIKEFLIEKFLLINGLVSIIVIALIFIFLFKEGGKAFTEIGLSKFIGDYSEDPITGKQMFRYVWQPVSSQPKFSVIPLICGTLLVAFPATLIASVFGIGTGIYLSEIASKKTREFIKPFIELLAGVPSVVIGFLMLVAVSSLVQEVFHTKFRLNAFVGAIGVALVIIPLIASITEDSLRAVPNELREASYGLGATRWQTIIGAVLPAGISGVTASVLLGFGRALGETMIVLMATGNAGVITTNIFSSVRTITATIAGELGSAPYKSEEYNALFFIGAILFTITFLLNVIAEIIIEKTRRKLKL